MNTRRGKGYFYSMGARMSNALNGYPLSRSEDGWIARQQWPEWAERAFENGYYGRSPK